MAAAKGSPMVSGYVVVDYQSGLIRCFRRSVVQAFARSDAHPGSMVLAVRIPQEQERYYIDAEVGRAERDTLPPAPRPLRDPRGNR